MSTQRLVAFLALRGRPLHRVHVAGSLWIDASEAHANACLRTALWRLKRLNATMVASTSTHLGLSDAVAVDARDTATRALEILHGASGGDDSVLALSQAGELLPDWYDDWVLIERERLRQLVLRALEHLAAEHRIDGPTRTTSTRTSSPSTPTSPGSRSSWSRCSPLSRGRSSISRSPRAGS